MADWAPDGGGVWRDGCAGLGYCGLFNTPEAVNERLPCSADGGRIAFTAEARIDNREDLFGLLEVPGTLRSEMPDGQLIFLAYQKWGDACTHRLLGDWSFAAWHHAERRLFLARDQHGITSLYYVQTGSRFAFASDRKALLALPDVPRRLNELYLAQVMVNWGEFHGAGTILEDIRRLPPAHSASVTLGTTRIRQYWHLETLSELRLGSQAAYADALLDIFKASVRCRLRSHRRVGCSLSGGLDSGSVTALAAAELAATGDELTALTSVPMVDSDVDGTRYGDEWPFASAVARSAPNILHLRVRAEDISPITAIEAMLDITGDPHRTPGNLYWLMALTATARQCGLGALLTGHTGNVTVSWDAGPRKGASVKRTSLRHLRSAMGVVVRKNILSAELRGWWSAVRRGGRIHRLGESWSVLSPINIDFARRLELSARIRELGGDGTLMTGSASREQRLRLLRIGRCSIGANWAQAAARDGLEVRDPTSDVRLISFVFSVPDEQWKGPTSRWLLRQAMTGILPESVRLSPRRGRQSSDIVFRLRQHAAQMQSVLADCERSAIGRQYLNLKLMRSVYRRILNRDDVQTAQLARSVLLKGITVGLFLMKNEGSLAVAEA